MNVYAKNRIIRAVSSLAAACILVIAASLSVGCTARTAIAFDREEFRLYVGDSRDLFPYAVFSPRTSADKSFSLESDSDCVTVSGTTVTAVATGTATLTAYASGGTAKIKIVTEYRSIENIEVAVSGETVQNVANKDDITPVELTAAIDGIFDPETAVEWSVNGKSAHSGDSFVFTPPDSGEYAVTARAGNAEYTCTVRVYLPTDVIVYYTGDTEQGGNFTPVLFVANEKFDRRNPASIAVWSVNGEPHGYGGSFSFIPPAKGEYEISLTVNGVRRKIGGEASVTVTATADRSPDCAVSLDGGVYIVWTDGELVRSIAVTAPNGVRTVYNHSDAGVSARFMPGCFDASGIIDPFSATPGTYTLRVTAEGVGKPCEFTQLPESAREYFETDVLCNNSFLTSPERAALWVKELAACGITQSSCYIAFDGDVGEAIKSAAQELGVQAEFAADGNIGTITLSGVYTAPQAYVTSSLERGFSEFPHIVYNQAQRRNRSEYKLMLDRAKRSVKVSNTEQLLLAALSGVRPEPKEGSVADAVYKRASNILFSIIGKNYGNAEKLHAIYDWVQWVTRSADGARSASPNFLEGVFGNTTEAPTGAVNSLGTAKAFALLCAMEGIPCEIVADVDDDGIYYYVQVELDGARYFADAFGGKSVFGNAEFNSHSRLLYGGDPSVTYYSQTEVFDGTRCGRYIYNGVSDEYVYALFNVVLGSATSVEIPLVAGNSSVYSLGPGAEVLIDPSLADSLDDVESALEDVINDIMTERYGDLATVQINFRKSTLGYGTLLHINVTVSAQ